MPNGDQLDQSQYLEVEMFDRELLPMEYDDREQDTRCTLGKRTWGKGMLALVEHCLAKPFHM